MGSNATDYLNKIGAPNGQLVTILGSKIKTTRQSKWSNTNPEFVLKADGSLGINNYSPRIQNNFN